MYPGVAMRPAACAAASFDARPCVVIDKERGETARCGGGKPRRNGKELYHFVESVSGRERGRFARVSGRERREREVGDSKGIPAPLTRCPHAVQKSEAVLLVFLLLALSVERNCIQYSMPLRLFPSRLELTRIGIFGGKME